MGGVDLQSLYAAQWRPLVRLAVLLVDDLCSAEDVVQDAFVGLHRHQSQLASPEAAGFYLRRSVINGSRSALRRRRTARLFLTRDRATGSPADIADQAPPGEQTELLAALDQLPGKQREVLVLRYWSELSEAEIAAVLKVPAGTVKSRASRGLRTMERLLRSPS